MHFIMLPPAKAAVMKYFGNHGAYMAGPYGPDKYLAISDEFNGPRLESRLRGSMCPLTSCMKCEPVYSDPVSFGIGTCVLPHRLLPSAHS